MLEDTFTDIIAKASFGKGIALPEAARVTSLSQNRFSSLEHGASPTDHEIDALANLLELDPFKLSQVARLAWEPHAMATSWDAAFVWKINGLIGNYPVNGYLFVDRETKEAALFDTGVSPERIIEKLKKEAIQLVAICITHAHPDHIGGVEKVQSETGAPIYLHPKELFGQGRRGITSLRYGMEISVGRFRIQSLATPGHTPGGTTYLISNDRLAVPAMAFVGDALFAGSIGRAQSAATYATLLHSVGSQILSLSGETILYPGHGPTTTGAQERAHNPFFIG